MKHIFVFVKDCIHIYIFLNIFLLIVVIQFELSYY